MPQTSRLRRIAIHPRTAGRFGGQRITLIHAAEISAAAALRWEAHRHQTHEVILATRGGYRCRIDDTEVAVPQGGMVLIAPGDRHQDLVAADTTYLGLVLALPMDGAPRFAADAPRSLRAIPAVPAYLAALVEEVIALEGVPGACVRTAQEALAGAVFWRALTLLPAAALAAETTPAGDGGFRARAEAAFHAAIHQPCTVSALAAGLGLPVRTFSARCRMVFGRSPARELVRRRMNEALALIGSGLPVACVARRLAFANPAHFTRVFRRAHGRPPSACRGEA